MLLILITLVLVLGVAFFQATQGMFSAIIMTVLTIFCTVLAFNYYEPLAQSFLYERMPEYADAVALISIFVLSLLALRLAFDKFLGRNLLTSMWVDRIGGGLLGLVTSLLVVGVFTIALQMLPWGQSILGWVAFDDTLKRSSGLFPYPDEFTIGLVETLSGGKPDGSATGSLAPEPAKPFSHAHDDLLLELWCARNTSRGAPTQENPQGEYLCGSTAAMPSALKEVWAYLPPDGAGGLKLDVEVPDNPLVNKPRSETRVFVIRAKIDEKGGAQEVDGCYRLIGSHFRLVSKNGKSYYPVGYLTHADARPNAAGDVGWKLIAPVDNGVALPGKLAIFRPIDKIPRPTVDWVYRIPLDETPSYMVFRKVARSPVPAAKPEMPDIKDALGRK